MCASLEPRNAVESIAALRFGESCSKLETRAGGQAGAGAAALRELVAEIDREIAEVQAVIVRDQRWEQRVEMRYDEVEMRDNFGAQKTTDLAEAEVDLGEPAAGVMIVEMDLEALDKRGLAGFSSAELRAALQSCGLDTAGEKGALFERLRAALVDNATLSKKKRQTIAHEVVSNVLVGAEEAEAKLEQLLTRKRALLGE